MTPEEAHDFRHADAARARRMIAAARAALGQAKAYGYVAQVDKCGILPTRHHWICRREGIPGWIGEPARDPEPMPPGPWKSPADAYGMIIKGEIIRTRRFEYYHSALVAYRPGTPEQLEARRRKREAKEHEREAQASPLFADQIRTEGPAPKRRKRRP